jgi:ribonucleoside-diphosphate reductase alpha chain
MNIQDWLGADNTLGISIWENKYQYNDETFKEWLDRVSNGDEEVKRLIVEKKFLFGGRILANRGLDKLGRKVTYSNCYVLPQVEDSIESIYKTCSDLARTFSYGGGCGIDISKLRPVNSFVNNTARKTSGACSFMDTFSQVTETIGQNGRRGALMISMDCSHPEIIDFINIKTDLERVTKANISVKITNDFMKAVKEDKNWELYFKTEHEEIKKIVKAKEIFRLLCKNNHEMAEPGILFWDRISNYNLLSEDKEFEYAGTNPCAEEPLPAGGSCLLGAMNLAEYVVNKRFDYESFKRDIHVVVKAMDEVLDQGLPLHPLQIQRDTVRDYRQIGIGIMGLADMLIKMEHKYDTIEAVYLCDEIGFTMANEVIKANALLAKEKGVYPKYNGTQY